MIKKFRSPFLLLLVLLIGAIILQSILKNHRDSETQKQKNELWKMHEETVLKIETGIDVYATVVSSIRAFIQNSTEFPTERQLQNFIYDLTRETNFKDSMVVSWVDTNQVFQYVVTPNEIDPTGLKGTRVRDLRPDFEIEMLNELMLEDSISLFNPINLFEGWAAFPFNFSARNSNGEILGYIAPVLNVKYLLNYPYKKHDDRFMHRFTLENNIDLTREVIYDGTTIYNKNRDPEDYKNFINSDSYFIFSTVNFYGLQLQIGTAYKEKPTYNNALILITYLWYGILCLFGIVILFQFSRNKRLNNRIKIAHGQIAIKNKQLEKNIGAIQILVKEIHHRVKNNMQIMSSLMNLQINSLENKETKSILNESRARIQSMSLVHQKLYGTENLTDVNVSEYVEQLISYVENILEINSVIPEKEIIVPSSISFNMNTMIPLGLIINELVTNSFKYAFNESGDKYIKLKIQEEYGEFKLIYSDSGPGIPQRIVPSESGTLGLELIYILTEQLEGKVQYNNSNSSTFIITFKKLNKQ